MPTKRRNIITKELLENYYINKHWNLLKISKLLGFSVRTIEIRAKELEIPLRSSGIPGPNISKEELKKLYVKQKLSSRKIAKIYKCAYSTIDRKIRNYDLPIKSLAAAHIITKRRPFSENLKEKAYILGFRIGDLRVRKMYKNSETILIDCASTHAEQIKLIKRLLFPYGRIWISKTYKTGKQQIECSVDNSFEFLLKKYSKFPSWVFKKNEIFLSILAGFIDAEGSFYITKDKKSAKFSLGNYNKAILKQIFNFLAKRKFHPKIFLGVKKGYTGKDGYSHNHNYWILTLDRKIDNYRFATLLKPHLKHKEKIRDCKKLLKNINYRNKIYGYKGIDMLKFAHEHKKHLLNNNTTVCQL
ncbi:MAG TPA: hypothetical protein VF185_00990 [Patescibacteria group bacterium]